MKKFSTYLHRCFEKFRYKTSATFYVPKSEQRSARLTGNITIFAAGLASVKLALLWVIDIF